MKVYKPLINRSYDKHLITIEWYTLSFNSYSNPREAIPSHPFCRCEPGAQGGCIAISGRFGFEPGSDSTVAQCCWKGLSIRQAASYPKLILIGYPSFHHPTGFTHHACFLLSLLTNNQSSV